MSIPDFEMRVRRFGGRRGEIHEKQIQKWQKQVRIRRRKTGDSPQDKCKISIKMQNRGKIFVENGKGLGAYFGKMKTKGIDKHKRKEHNSTIQKADDKGVRN